MDKVGKSEFELLAPELSTRPILADAQLDHFLEFYCGIASTILARNSVQKTALINELKNKSLNMFYFYNDDTLFFERTAGATILNNEKLLRNTLRKEMYSHLKFTKKIRQLDYLNKIANPGKIDPLDKPKTERDLAGTFIGIKKERYKIFCDQIVDFALSMISSIYWKDFKTFSTSQYTLLECIEYVIPIVYKMEEAFSQVLDEEFDTSEIEKSAGLKADKSIVKEDKKPLKVKRKRKTKKTKDEIPEKAEEDEKD